jgi:hypothetical protein
MSSMIDSGTLLSIQMELAGGAGEQELRRLAGAELLFGRDAGKHQGVALLLDPAPVPAALGHQFGVDEQHDLVGAGDLDDDLLQFLFELALQGDLERIVLVDLCVDTRRSQEHEQGCQKHHDRTARPVSHNGLSLTYRQ